jgi:EpsI family protein
MATIVPSDQAHQNLLRRNMWFLLVLSAVSATLVLLLPPLRGKVIRDIDDSLIPFQLGSWVGQRYDMGAKVFDVLRPDAIISRHYFNEKGQQLDFVLLAGTHAETFHNPHTCFPSQGWKLEKEQKIVLSVPGINQTFHARLFSVNNNGQKATVIYWFRTPFGTTGSMGLARVSTFTARLIGMQRQQTFFFRFTLPSTGDTQQDVETIRRFAADLFGALKQTLPEVI